MKKGSSVTAPNLQNETYQKLLDNFDCLYESSGFHFDGLERAKILSRFCIQHGKEQRGHFLIHPKTLTADLLNVEKILETFPNIKDWDLWLEPFREDGSLKIEKKIIWESFSMAKGEGRRLFLCDHFRNNEKAQSIYDFLKHSLAAKIPIDGVSIQMHSNLRSPFGRDCLTLNWRMVQYWLKKFHSLGMVVLCPEIVVWQFNSLPYALKPEEIQELNRKFSINRIVSWEMRGKPLGIWGQEELQARAYEQLVECCRADAEMVGFQSPFDAFPWNWSIFQCKAGLWDEEFNPKKAIRVLNKI